MSLWEAISGKIYRWNGMKTEANVRVCKGLKPFVVSRLGQYPNGQPAFMNARNHLFAYYTAATARTSILLDTEFAKHKDRFYSFNADLYLRFISAFHATFVTVAYSSPEKRSLLYLMSDGIVEMYARTPGYMERWWAHIELLQAKHPNAMLKVGDQLYGEIAPLLGLPEVDRLFGPLYWLGIQMQFADVMAEIYNGKKWAEAVEEQMAATH